MTPEEHFTARLQRMNDETDRYIAERRKAMAEDQARWSREMAYRDRWGASVQVFSAVGSGAMIFAAGMLTEWALR